MSEAIRPKTTIDWIQAMRGIAAVLVVVTHARLVLTEGFQLQVSWPYMAHGALGVDLFFIISGFIMMLTTRDCDGSGRYVADFAIKRFARIWPLLLVVSIVYLVIRFCEPEGITNKYLRAMASQMLLRPFEPQPMHFFALPIDVAWTLCFEAYFYVVMAISLFSVRWRWWIIALLLAPGLVVYPIVKGIWNFSFYHQPTIFISNYANVMVSPMVWEFVLGLIAGALYTSKSPWTIPSRGVAKLFIGLALAAFITLPWTHVPTVYGPTFTNGGMTMFVMFTLTALASKTINIHVPRWFVWLGTISYSLYLTQRLGFLVADSIAPQLASLQNKATREWLHFALRMASAVAVGAFFYYAAEAPLSKWTRNTLMRITRKATAKNTNAPASPKTA